MVLPWYLIELHGASIKLRALAAQVWRHDRGRGRVSLLPIGLGRVMTDSLAILLIGGVVALGTISLLILRLQPEFAALRSTFAESGEPATTESMQPAVIESSGLANAAFSNAATIELPVIFQSSEPTTAALSEAATIELPVIFQSSEPTTAQKYVGRHRGMDLLRGALPGHRANGDTHNGTGADELAALRPARGARKR